MAETPKNSKPSKRTESWWSKNWFYITLVLVAVIGGGCAFTLPYYFQREGDNIWSLRQAILAATGGVLAILTLWENRRKNIQEKEKNDQDHTRQVHAERRARYTKAVEQLAEEKAPIRLGGVYTLAKLVDDWLDDEKTLPSMEKRRQEGQIIIDSLCAYIRSSFPLAERHEELSSDYEDYKKKCQNNKIKILTIEDPIEYIFENKKALIIQRELGTDVESFEKALKSSLRQDPDVIILGEIRDEESLFSALKLAETGHLVFSTLHTMNTVESVNRLISMVRTEKKDFVREQLASVLRFILSQELHRGKKTVPIFEILNNTKAVANLILNNKLNQIPTLIESGIENFMITKAKYLKNLETESD